MILDASVQENSEQTSKKRSQILEILQFLQEWNLDKEKQVCLTTDCGANIVKAVTLNMWTRLSSLAIVYTLLLASLLFLS